MTERRLSNSELHLQQLEEQELRERQSGILELFDEPLDEALDGADEPLARDEDR